MAPSAQEGSVVVPAMTNASIPRPARQRLPIIPAIPRKLEKQLRQTSSLAAGSRSATYPTLDAPTNHPLVRVHEQQHISREPAPDNRPDTHSIKHSEETEQPPLEEFSNKDNTSSMASATGDNTAATTTTTTKMPSAVNLSSSVFDPESPEFIPETSKTPTETLDGTSSVDGHPSHPQVPYSMQTTAPVSWAPYESTSPHQSLRSPVQQDYAPYGQPPPLFYAPTVLPNDRLSNSSIYYGYDPSRNMSFYPRASRSYVSASLVQSSYEGYAVANTPQAIHTRAMSSSQLHHRSTAENAQSLSVYTPSPYQPQHARPIPQFGNNFPITPSATPSNSGSQKQEPSPIDATQHIVPLDQPFKVDSKADSASKTSQKYQEWSQQIMETLQGNSDRPEIPRALSEYLVTNFNNPTFADCELYISHVSHRFEPVVVSLHSLLIAQNPRLKALLQNAEVREDGKKQMLLNVKDAYADPAALKSAVRMCYGERSSRYTGYPGEFPSEQEVSKAWMNNALAFAAAGHVLEMTGAAHRGEQIASMILGWDNLEQALSFAMDATIQRAWGSPMSSSSFPCNASELLLSCLYFVISNISGTVRLDLSAKPLPSVNRLPTASASDGPSPRSRLSRIQFGELPVENEDPISKHDILTSAILFSLPSDHIKFILDRVPQDVNIEITKAVVQERERRRLRTLHAIASTSSVDVHLHPSLAEEESVFEREGRLCLERA
ncbi:MAG: hypothetical protein L6R36_007129 [Xanthoria steineri]|nr:MAG: hypothetical protein L6R36_007129 [Xanthoria steineri]